MNFMLGRPGFTNRTKAALLFCLVMILASFATAQTDNVKYWTPYRIATTAGVTILHGIDAGQTCYHLREGWTEHGFMTPTNCPGAAIYLIGIGPVTQYASYRLSQRFAWWKPIDRILPYVEMSFSVSGIHCSYSQTGCGKSGF